MTFFSGQQGGFSSEEELQQQQTGIVQVPVIDEQAMTEAETMEAHEQAMTEVEDRFEKAKTYDMVRRNPFIEQTSQQAFEVQTEIQKFVEVRLQLLMGMTPEPELMQYVLSLVAPNATAGGVGGPFDKEQTVALQAWANKLLKRPSYFEVQSGGGKPAPAAPVVKAEPAMKVVQAPQPMRPKPVKTRPTATQTAQQRRPVAPMVKAPQQQTQAEPAQPKPKKTMQVQAPNGKVVTVSLDQQTKPSSAQPAPWPNPGQGIDNTRGGSQAPSMLGNNVKNRLISHFLNS